MSRARKKRTSAHKNRSAPRAAGAAMESASGDASQAAPSADDVAQLAFQFFVDSGFVHGHALDHWLRAEAELGQGGVGASEPG